MFLSGHLNTETASSYYTNISKFLECKISRQYRKVIGGQVEYAISHYTPKDISSVGVLLESGSRCFSEAYKSGMISDCINVIGPNGEIGYCPNCQYYSNVNNVVLYKRSISDDCNALRDAIEVVRAGKGEESTIGETMLRLQSSTLSYEAYLKEIASNNPEN